jgi:hypothetical protein
MGHAAQLVSVFEHALHAVHIIWIDSRVCSTELSCLQVAMMGYVQPLIAGHRWWMVCFISLVAGNATDVLFQIHYQHHDNIRRYLSNHVAKLDVAVNFGLLGLMLASVERVVLHRNHSLEDELGEEPASLAVAGLSWLWIAASACAGGFVKAYGQYEGRSADVSCQCRSSIVTADVSVSQGWQRLMCDMKGHSCHAMFHHDSS